MERTIWDRVNDLLHFLPFAGATLLAVGAVSVTLHRAPEPAPLPAVTVQAPATEVGAVEGVAGAAEPFAGYNPQIEAWASEYHWGTMEDLSKRWDPSTYPSAGAAKKK